MGRDITLATAPNGAITNTDVLQNLAAPFRCPELNYFPTEAGRVLFLNTGAQ
jgi:hypothetical protein